MAAGASWKLAQSALDYATRLGEEIAKLNGFIEPPVDPFKVLAEERRIRSFGADFGNAFDGRLEFQSPQFLLFYNTKYNTLPHDGIYHPKVRFTIGHELGHYYLDEHREYLIHGGAAHRSYAEFTADPLVERQADAFAGGLLMPSYLLSPLVNRHAMPTMKSIFGLKNRFDVSLISILVRWVQVSDFPCAVIACRNGLIDWGFVSEGFRRHHAYRVRRGCSVASQDAKAFFAVDPLCTRYREGAGSSIAMRWLDTESSIQVEEFYVALSFMNMYVTFLTAPESEDDYENDDNDYS